MTGFVVSTTVTVLVVEAVLPALSTAVYVIDILQAAEGPPLP